MGGIGGGERVNESGAVGCLGGVAMAKKHSFPQERWRKSFAFGAVAANDFDQVGLQVSFDASSFRNLEQRYIVTINILVWYVAAIIKLTPQSRQKSIGPN